MLNEIIIQLIAGTTVSLAAVSILSVMKELLTRRIKTKIKIGGIEIQVNPEESKEAYGQLVAKISELKGQPQVFIVYAHEEKDFVRKLCEDLESAGVRVWFDERELRPGDRISSKIKEGMEESQWIIFVPPREEHKKGWVFKEMRMALDAEKSRVRPLIIPVKTQTNVIPSSVSDRLWADFSKKYEDGLQSLLRGIAGQAEVLDAYIKSELKEAGIALQRINIDIMKKTSTVTTDKKVPEEIMLRIREYVEYKGFTIKFIQKG